MPVRLVKTINKDFNRARFLEQLGSLALGEHSLSLEGFVRTSTWVYSVDASSPRPGQMTFVFHKQDVDPGASLDNILAAHDATEKSVAEQDQDSSDTDKVFLRTELGKVDPLSDAAVKAMGRILLQET